MWGRRCSEPPPSGAALLPGAGSLSHAEEGERRSLETDWGEGRRPEPHLGEGAPPTSGAATLRTDAFFFRTGALLSFLPPAFSFLFSFAI